MDLSVIEIVESLKQGNKGVFEQLFRNHYEALCNYGFSILKDMDESEELVQETFYAIWEKREELEIHTSVKSYLYRALHNRCLNSIKHKKVEQVHNDWYRHTNDEEDAGNTDAIIATELEQKIAEAINSLPPQCGMVFRLSRMEGLTYQEIADQMGLSVKTVENHMGKALRIMRDELSDYLPLLILIFLN